MSEEAASYAKVPQDAARRTPAADLPLPGPAAVDTRVLGEVRHLLGSKFGYALQDYLFNMRDWIEAIIRAAGDDDAIDRILLAAHAVRTSSLHLGAWRLAGAAAIIEGAAHKAASQRRRLDPGAMLGELRYVFERTQLELQLYAARYGIEVS